MRICVLPSKQMESVGTGQLIESRNLKRELIDRVWGAETVDGKKLSRNTKVAARNAGRQCFGLLTKLQQLEMDIEVRGCVPAANDLEIKHQLMTFSENKQTTVT
jgi:hypothetical protein